MSRENLSAIREEYDSLTKALNRAAILTLTAAVLLVLGVTNGFREVTAMPEFLQLMELEVSEARTAEVHRELLAPWSSAFEYRPTAGFRTETDAGVAQLAKIQPLLMAKADQVFRREVSILGSKVHVDLRYALLLVPPVLWMSGAFGYLVIRKREALQRLGEHLLQTTADPSPIDRLMFAEKDAPYAEYPGRVLWGCYAVALLAALGTLVWATQPLWIALDEFFAAMAAIVFWLISAWIALYIRRATGRIDRQVSALVGLRVEPGPTVDQRILAWLAMTVGRARGWHRTAAVGAVLVLSTLVMPVGCAVEEDADGATVTGLELVAREGVWIAAVPSAIRMTIAWAAYCACLLLAVTTVILIVARVTIRGSRASAAASRFLATLAIYDLGLAAPLAMLEIANFGMFSVGHSYVVVDLATIAITLLVIVYPAVALALRWRRPERRWTLERLRRFHGASFFPPLVPASLASGLLFVTISYYGVLVHLIGSLALAVGWYGIAAQSSSSTSAAHSPAATCER